MNENKLLDALISFAPLALAIGLSVLVVWLAGPPPGGW